MWDDSGMHLATLLNSVIQLTQDVAHTGVQLVTMECLALLCFIYKYRVKLKLTPSQLPSQILVQDLLKLGLSFVMI